MPESVAVLGCAGGNGFDRIELAVTIREVATLASAWDESGISPKFCQT